MHTYICRPPEPSGLSSLVSFLASAGVGERSAASCDSAGERLPTTATSSSDPGSHGGLVGSGFKRCRGTKQEE